MGIFYIPTTLNPSFRIKIIERNFRRVKEKSILRSLVYVLDFFSQKYLSGESTESGIKLHSSILRKIVNHRNSAKLMQALRREKIIKLSRGYFPGDHSNTYEFEPWVIERGFTKINAEYERKKTLAHELRDLDSLLKDDDSIIRRTTESLLQVKFPPFEQLDFPGKTAVEISCREYALERFKNKEFHCSFDRFGRLHSNFTNLPKDLRCLAKIKGQWLVGLDIKSCFPTLMFRFVDNPTEKIKFSDWIRRGVFYENLMNILGYDSTLREFLKEEFNAWVNGGYRPAIDAVMKKEFPYLHARKRSVTKTNYRNLGYELMRLEGAIMLRETLKTFWSVKKDAFALSVHDAIFSTDEHIDLLAALLGDAFLKYVGIRPRVAFLDCRTAKKKVFLPTESELPAFRQNGEQVLFSNFGGRNT